MRISAFQRAAGEGMLPGMTDPTLLTAAFPVPMPPEAAPAAALAREECLRPENRFGPAFLEQHLAPATGLALALAPRLGADPLTVALAGWLHDLAAVRDFSCLPDHHAQGARVARELLRPLGFPPARIEAVARTIETHSFPVKPGQGTPEQVCLSNADVLSHLARPAYWTWYLYGPRGMTFEGGLTWLRGRIGPAFEALTPEAQALGAADRAAVAKLVGG
jgi:uncharacterized protein